MSEYPIVDWDGEPSEEVKQLVNELYEECCAFDAKIKELYEEET